MLPTLQLNPLKPLPLRHYDNKTHIIEPIIIRDSFVIKTDSNLTVHNIYLKCWQIPYWKKSARRNSLEFTFIKG